MPWRRMREWRYSSTHSLTSSLDGSEWSASRPGRFTPTQRAPRTHWIGGWVGPWAVLDAVVKRKIPSLRRESNPRTLTVQPVAQRYTDWTLMALELIPYLTSALILSSNLCLTSHVTSSSENYKSKWTLYFLVRATCLALHILINLMSY
jgi:hypothetical protein